MAESESLEGTVLRVVFAAPDGAFAVVRLDVAGRDQPVTVTGPLSETTPGELLKLEGHWETHKVHGEQFRATRAVVEVPRTGDGIERYLQGIKGIGPELARRLVAAFGVSAVEVIEKEPWRAAQVKGMGKRRAERASGIAAQRRQEREVMIFLQGLGVSLAYAGRIYKTYGDQAIARVRENPYRLARDVAGIGFFIADRIARGMGIDPASPLRIQAGVLHALGGFGDDGHVFAPRPELERRAAEALDVDALRVGAAIDQLALEGAVILDGGGVYQPWMFRAEVETARRIRQLLAAPRPPPPPPLDDAQLSDGQRRAIAQVGAAAVAVITGGPGTGKTTIVRALVASWEKARRRVMLAAPTGRAAKRLTEATGRPAQTVHRLLEWGRAREGRRTPFGRDADHPLETDLLVVDEASMLDLQLARGLTSAVPLGATLVLIGDVNQLPSVGPGHVLGDLIASHAVPVARLTEVFRQSEGSGIIENAYRILEGEVPRAEENGDFYVVRADEPERARDLVVRMCRDRIPERFGLDPRRDVQVLAPMHRGVAGTEELNRALQAALNPSGEEVAHAGRVLRVGDKVMQLRNDYDRDVFNGDLGLVAAAVMEEGAPLLEVDFDGRRVRYEADDLDALELAYAVSVHKSQGSEYPAVVVTMLMQHFMLLKRNLFYTAVTRGRRLVVVVGSPRAIERAVAAAEVDERHTALTERLRAADDKLRT
ncbi:MAG TPA: ATP-dependent RecD-like DNA helicase [Polyangia bacterium]|nr:ATP-dependent RecD-like DNA helicase [Polyangia bacterium]